MIEPLAAQLAGLFPFPRRRAARCCHAARPRAEAREAFDRAIALANTPQEAAHIRMHHRPLDIKHGPNVSPEGLHGGFR